MCYASTTDATTQYANAMASHYALRPPPIQVSGLSGPDHHQAMLDWQAAMPQHLGLGQMRIAAAAAGEPQLSNMGGVGAIRKDLHGIVRTGMIAGRQAYRTPGGTGGPGGGGSIGGGTGGGGGNAPGRTVRGPGG